MKTKKLMGPHLCDVIHKHGGRMQDVGIKNMFLEFDTVEAAIACAAEMRAGGVYVEGVREGDPNGSNPNFRLPGLTYRPD